MRRRSEAITRLQNIVKQFCAMLHFRLRQNDGESPHLNKKREQSRHVTVVDAAISYENSMTKLRAGTAAVSACAVKCQCTLRNGGHVRMATRGSSICCIVTWYSAKCPCP